MDNEELALLERLKSEVDEAAAYAMREASRFVQLGRDIDEQLARHRSTHTERTSCLRETWLMRGDLPGAA